MRNPLTVAGVTARSRRHAAPVFSSFLAGLAVVSAFCIPAAADTCVRDAMWAVDSTNNRLVTIATDGTNTVCDVAPLTDPDLQGITWSKDGTKLFGVRGNTIYEVDTTTGALTPTGATVGGSTPPLHVEQDPNEDFMVSLADTTAGTTELHVIPKAGGTATIYGPFSGAVALGGLASSNCDNTVQYGFRETQANPLQLFFWIWNGLTWGIGQLNPVSIPAPVSSIASDGARFYTVSSTNRLYFFTPETIIGPPYTPATSLGILPFQVSALSFGPTAPGCGGTTTTTTSTTTTTLGCETTTTTLAPPDPQAKEQQDCLVAMMKVTRKVVLTQGKETSRCAKSRSKGTEPEPDVCQSADSRGKMTALENKAAEVATERCSAGAAPDFGYEGPVAAVDGGRDPMIALAGDLFGTTLKVIPDTSVEPALSPVARCQTKFWTAAAKLAATKIGVLAKCEKLGLAGKKGKSIVSADDLRDCLDDIEASAADPKGKVSKGIYKLALTAGKLCLSVAHATAFPGRCRFATTTEAFVNCVEQRVECRACLTLSGATGVQAPCDLFDDGLHNCSCGAGG